MNEEKDLFVILLKAVQRKKISLERAVDLCYEYGVDHGKALKVAMANNPSFLIKNDPNSSSSSANNSNPNQSEITQNATSEDTQNKNNLRRKNTVESIEGEENGNENSKKRKLNDDTVERTDTVQDDDVTNLNDAIKQFVGVSIVTEDEKERYRATITIEDHVVEVGSFDDAESAAIAHDRAMIRAYGPKSCPALELNYAIENYAKDPLETFSAFDAALRKQLFGTSWTGPKDCDFSFLMMKNRKSSKTIVANVVSTNTSSANSSNNSENNNHESKKKK